MSGCDSKSSWQITTNLFLVQLTCSSVSRQFVASMFLFVKFCCQAKVKQLDVSADCVNERIKVMGESGFELFHRSQGKNQRTIETKIVWLEITVYDTVQEDGKGAREMRIHNVTQSSSATELTFDRANIPRRWQYQSPPSGALPRTPWSFCLESQRQN